MLAQVTQGVTDWTPTGSRLKGPVRRIQIEQARLTAHYDEWQEETRQRVVSVSFDEHARIVRHTRYGDDGTMKQKVTYAYDPDTNTTNKRISGANGLLKSHTTIVAEQKDQQEIRTVYSEKGRLQRKLITEQDAQSRTTSESQYNAAGVFFRRVVHTADAQGLRGATTRYDATESLAGPIATTNYEYAANGQLQESQDYGPDGLLIQKWGYTDEVDSHQNWTKRTVSRWVNKFGSSYLEPVRVIYRTITYYPEPNPPEGQAV